MAFQTFMLLFESLSIDLYFLFRTMGNSEGSHQRSTYSNSPQHTTSTLPNSKSKKHQRAKSANPASGHELHADVTNDNYYTCKSSLTGVGQQIKQIAVEAPSTYFYQYPANPSARRQSLTLTTPVSRDVRTNNVVKETPLGDNALKKATQQKSVVTEVNAVLCSHSVCFSLYTFE